MPKREPPVEPITIDLAKVPLATRKVLRDLFGGGPLTPAVVKWKRKGVAG